MVGLYEDDDGANDYLEEHRALQAAVGDCIHSWCCLEGSLVSLLSWALNTPLYKANIAFRCISGFGVKLSIIDELMKDEFVDRPELKFWTGMHTNLKALSTARNTIAHFSPVYEIESGGERISGVVHRTGSKKQVHGFTLVGIQLLCASIKRHADLLDGLVFHLDETKICVRVYHMALKPLEFAGKTLNPLQLRRQNSRVREKEQPPSWFSITPQTTDDEIRSFLTSAGVDEKGQA